MAERYGSRITRRMVALFVACALLPVAATLLLSYGRVIDALLDQRIGQLRGAAATYATSLIDRLGVAELLARSVAADLAAAPTTRVDKGFEIYFRAVVLFESTGPRVLFGDPARVPPPDAFDAVENRLVAGGTALALPTGDGAAAGGVWIVTTAKTYSAGALRLALELDPGYLWGSVEDLPYMTEICVLGPERTPLACANPLPESALAAIRERLGSASEGNLAWDAGGARYVGGFREVFLYGRFGAEPWSVVASHPEEHALAPVRAIRKLVVPVVLLGLLAAALLGLIQVRRTLRPLKDLTEATRSIAAHDFDVRVSVTRDDEFGTLAHAFNSMSARLGGQFSALLAHAEIDAIILSNVDLTKIATIVLRRIDDLASPDHCYLLLAESEAAGCFQSYSDGDSGEIRSDATMLSEADARALLANPNSVASVSGFPGRSVFALPIILGDELAGALVLSYDAERAPGAGEIAYLRELGDRVAVALATARRDRELHRRAHYDSLTQLPNRLLGIEELVRAVAGAERQARLLAVLFIDLDGFGAVNDSLGHSAGDGLLVQTAGRLRRCLRQSDIVARIGGDEFAVVLTEIREATDAAIAARHLVEALSMPFQLGDGSTFVSASVGIALYPGDGRSAEELLRHADLAMYNAKSSGRGHVVFFESSMNAEVQRRVDLERELRLALEQDQFVLHYQPQVDLSTGRIIGSEALIRWRHPVRGLVPPMQFIGFAETSGLIEEIGQWVLEAACAQFVAWQRDRLPIDHVSVNVSARQFRKSGFAQLVADILRASGMPAGALRLEMTESAVIDDIAATNANLVGLVKLGTPLELDDFGTGYSSLAYLQRLPVATVKLDQAFIRTMETSRSTQAVVRAAIDMAHALGKSVVAEGVENERQAALLTNMKCDTMQGYYLSEPVPAFEFSQLVRSRQLRRSSYG